jgi:hypothetical protein
MCDGRSIIRDCTQCMIGMHSAEPLTEANKQQMVYAWDAFDRACYIYTHCIIGALLTVPDQAEPLHYPGSEGAELPVWHCTHK